MLSANSSDQRANMELTQVGGDQFKKLTLLQQVLLRPDTYIGPTNISNEPVWVATISKDGIVDIKFVTIPICLAICMIAKEALDNSSDNIERSKRAGMDPGTIQIELTPQTFTVRNFGKHIALEIHRTEKVPVPEVIFGTLLTSDNYNDEEERFKVGRNGYGVKLLNIFSQQFRAIITDPVQKLKYTQVWEKNMRVKHNPVIETYTGPGYTEVTAFVDFQYFYKDPKMPSTFISGMDSYFLHRAMGLSFANKIITSFNGVNIDYRDGKIFMDAHLKNSDISANRYHWISKDNLHEFIVVELPGNGFCDAYVNGTAVPTGEHVNEFIRIIFDDFMEKFVEKYKKQYRDKTEKELKLSVAHFKKHIGLIVRSYVDKPEFGEQCKTRLIKPTPKIPIEQTDLFEFKNIWKTWNGLADAIKKSMGVGEAAKAEKRAKFIPVGRVQRAEKAKSSLWEERQKCTLILTEGATGFTLADLALKYLPGGNQYNGILSMRGKPMNVEKHDDAAIAANKELSTIMLELNAEYDVDYLNDSNKRRSLRYGRIALFCDADHDAYHIQGIMLQFIIEKLKTLAPFQFCIIIMTPIIRAIKGKEYKQFYFQRHYDQWAKENPAEAVLWKCSYYKGLGSWTPEPETLKELFSQPKIITMDVDDKAYSMLKLAFNKHLTDERKQWIIGHNPHAPLIISNPRPVSHFFNSEFLDYSKESIRRAIPDIRDGMKPVHRKVIYTALKAFSSEEKRKKLMKIPQFGGMVMQMATYHHGEQSLYSTVIGQTQEYVTGPNTIPLLKREGNTGTRKMRGADQSPARYLQVGLADITLKIFRPEDNNLYIANYEDGEQIEHEFLLPIICLTLCNKCEGIATGWSTKIPTHNPLKILAWQRAWIEQMRHKRGIPRHQLSVELSGMPELVPFWRGWKGTMIRVKNTPHEEYLTMGVFYNDRHIIHVTELPPEMKPHDYYIWCHLVENAYLDGEKPKGVGGLVSGSTSVPTSSNNSGIGGRGINSPMQSSGAGKGKKGAASGVNKEYSLDGAKPKRTRKKKGAAVGVDANGVPSSGGPNTNNGQGPSTISSASGVSTKSRRKGPAAVFRSFAVGLPSPDIDFLLHGAGVLNPQAYKDLGKLNLIRKVSLSNMILIDETGTPKKYNYNFEIISEWCMWRLPFYEKRRLMLLEGLTRKINELNLKYNFVLDYIEGRLKLRRANPEEYIPYMDAKGYPHKDVKDASGKVIIHSFLNIPIGTLTDKKLKKLQADIQESITKHNYYNNIWCGDMWLNDLAELEPDLVKLDKTPLSF